MTKSEIRNPKEARSPKSEISNRTVSASAFDIRPALRDFGFRRSEFGFYN
jgi:hypothetical protein